MPRRADCADSDVHGQDLQVTAPVADLLRSPEGGIERQVLFGHEFRVFETKARDGFACGQVKSDGYMGYVDRSALGPVHAVTHKITALSTHLYSLPDMKSPTHGNLPFAARINVIAQSGDYLTLFGGRYVPRQHVGTIDTFEDDYVRVMENFLGIPYLWGGNSTRGMDCSGAVQLALQACNTPCPRNSHKQEESLGRQLEPGAGLQRGDLIFWKGHVGVMVDDSNIIHANATHMAVALEPLDIASKRIAATQTGDITSIRRVPLSGVSQPV